MPSKRDNSTRLFALVSLGLAILFLLPGHPTRLGDDFDRWSFRLWSELFPADDVAVSDDLVLVYLPDDMRTAIRPSAALIGQLNRMLAKLKNQGAASIGFAADLTPLLWSATDIASLLPEAGNSSVSSQTAPYRELDGHRADRQVSWLGPSSRGPAQSIQIDREYRWPPIYTIHERLLKHYFEQPGHGMEPRALLSYQRGQLLAGFELSLLALMEGAPAVRWQIPDTLIIGERQQPISMYGSIRPWPQQQALAALDARALSPAQLDRGNTHGKIVLLGYRDDPGLEDHLASVNALLTRQYSYTPWWQGLPLSAVTLLLWGYGVYAFRRFSTGALILAGLVMVGLPAALSVLVQAQRGLWIDTGDTQVFAVCVLAILLSYRLYWCTQLRTRMDADDARMELAQLHLEQSNPDSAANQLLQTTMTVATADLLMETGRAFERQRDYRAAQETYSTINQYFPGNRNAATALEDIANITGQYSGLESTLTLPEIPPALSQLGRYKLIRQLGKGAMGTVYLARDPKIQREVAIKTLSLKEIEQHSDDLRERFFREAQAAGKLQHPNIVSVYDVGEEGDLAYIAMDYVPGGTLSDWTHHDGLLDLELLYSLMAQVASALACAHQQGVIHRDIKPGNILYNPEDGTVKVTDFGIARLADYSRTKTGAILGSPYYMSPEQVSGKKVGPASDIYSLGVSFYQLLSGALPFEAESLAQLAWQITNNPHRNIGRFRKGLPRSASRIINTALKKEPRERFRNAGEMSEALEKGAKTLAAARRQAS